MPLRILHVRLDGASVADSIMVGGTQRLQRRATRLDLVQRHLDPKVPCLAGVLLHPVRVQQRQVDDAVRQLGGVRPGTLMEHREVERLLVPRGELPWILTDDGDVSDLGHGRCSLLLRHTRGVTVVVNLGWPIPWPSGLYFAVGAYAGSGIRADTDSA